ncbi:MAG: riboflavin synthase [Desulfobacterales bacterium]|nr:riboflavin synthase [Desulfobacterales bacterium]
MFTGIIEGFGTIKNIKPSGKGEGRIFSIDSDFDLTGTKIGDSIAVNGACLTAVSLSEKRFDVDVAYETLSMSTHGKSVIGERVNLERAMRLSDRLDGHLVSGHIDGTGIIKEKKNLGNAVIVTISISEDLSSQMIKKGSVAIDGISLTINKLERDSFEISIIPHTAKITTIGIKNAGDRVNIETDMIGKYVQKLVLGKKNDEKKSNIDMDFLTKNGFL